MARKYLISAMITSQADIDGVSSDVLTKFGTKCTFVSYGLVGDPTPDEDCTWTSADVVIGDLMHGNCESNV